MVSCSGPNDMGHPVVVVVIGTIRIKIVVITTDINIINAVVDWVPLIFWVFTLCLALQS